MLQTDIESHGRIVKLVLGLCQVLLAISPESSSSSKYFKSFAICFFKVSFPTCFFRSSARIQGSMICRWRMLNVNHDIEDDEGHFDDDFEDHEDNHDTGIMIMY